MIKKNIFIVPFMFLLQLIIAQRHELGFQMGTTNLVGDIGRTNYILQKPIKDVSTYGLPLTIGIMYKMNFNPYQGIRFNLGYYNIQYSDAYAKEKYRWVRRDLDGLYYSGTNKIYNIDAQFEYNFLPLNNEQKSMFSPYIFGGIGVILYDENKVTLDFTDYTFVDADEDGVIDNYPIYSSDYSTRATPSLKKSTAFSLPFGVGLKYKFNYNWAIFGEVKFRYNFTDNIDNSKLEEKDVRILYNRDDLGRIMTAEEFNAIAAPYVADRQVGNPNSNDWINAVNIGISYSFGRPPCYCE